MLCAINFLIGALCVLREIQSLTKVEVIFSTVHIAAVLQHRQSMWKLRVTRKSAVFTLLKGGDHSQCQSVRSLRKKFNSLMTSIWIQETA